MEPSSVWNMSSFDSLLDFGGGVDEVTGGGGVVDVELDDDDEDGECDGDESCL